MFSLKDRASIELSREGIQRRKTGLENIGSVNGSLIGFILSEQWHRNADRNAGHDALRYPAQIHVNYSQIGMPASESKRDGVSDK
jgi:hypothetical protein